MPRSVSVKAARSARGPRVADLRIGRGVSIAEAMELLKDDFYDRASVARMQEITLRSGRVIRKGDSMVVDHHHLTHLVSEAEAALKAAWWPEGNSPLPYNWNNPHHSAWGGWDFNNARAKTQRVARDHGTEIVRGYTRTAAFLRFWAAGKFPAVKKLFERGCSTRGYNSPYNRLNIFAFVARMKTPGRAERMLWATKAKAEAVLSAYKGGLKPSWVSIAEALMADGRPAKAGLIAAAMTLGFSLRHKQGAAYRAAREWMVEHRSAAFPHTDTTDGVECRLAADAELNKLGITVTLALVVGVAGRETGKREIICFVRKGERTFHSRWGGATGAMHDAIRAWKRQDEAMRMGRMTYSALADFLDGTLTGACPLVRRENSYAAGNCSPGTESWLCKVGFTNRDFIPGWWLIAHLTDERVRRVVITMMTEELRNVARTDKVSCTLPSPAF